MQKTNAILRKNKLPVITLLRHSIVNDVKGWKLSEKKKKENKI